MKSAADIAGDKIHQFMGELMTNLDSDIQALYRKQSAAGMLRSGNTFSAVMSLIKNSYTRLSDFLVEQYKWAISETLIVKSDFIDSLKSQGKFYLEQQHKNAYPKLQNAAKTVGKESLFEQFLPEITKSLEDSYNSLLSEINSMALEKKNKGIKGVIKAITGFLPKLTGK